MSVAQGGKSFYFNDRPNYESQPWEFDNIERPFYLTGLVTQIPGYGEKCIFVIHCVSDCMLHVILRHCILS